MPAVGRRGAGGQSRPPLHALSLRASAHTGAAIRSQRGAAALTGRRTPRAFVPLRSTAGRRPLQSIAGTNVRLAAGHMGPALQSAARGGRAESSATTRSVIASQCSHWRGNPSLQCGGTHGSRPTECGAERADRVVRPYTLCHSEPMTDVTGAAIRFQRGAAALTGRRGRRPLRNSLQSS